MTKEVKKMEGYVLQTEGEVSDTTISKIEEGVICDFIPKDKLQFADGDNIEERANQKAVQVSTANGARKIIALPKEGMSLHPKSTLALWKKTYRDGFPFVGQKVATELDDKGFQRIVLKQR